MSQSEHPAAPGSVPQQGRNFKFLPRIGIRREDGAEPQSLVFASVIPELKPKSLFCVFVKVICLSDGDIKHGGPLCAF